MEDTYTYLGFGLGSFLVSALLFGSRKKAIKQEPDQKWQNQKLKYIFCAKIPESIKLSHNTLLEELKFLDSPTCEIMKVKHLAWEQSLQKFPQIESPLYNQQAKHGDKGHMPDECFIYQGSYVMCTLFQLASCNYGPNRNIKQVKKWLKAGPRKHLYFRPKEVRAAIVTCGGLCPGLNNVIREIVMTLNQNYGVTQIYGIQYGYKGFYSYDWIPLNPEFVKNIHTEGGTILGSSRGGFKGKEIVDALVDKGINQVYLIGGDGTHRGIVALSKEVSERNLQIGICGLPKTIDNDIPIIDKSFGFETSVNEAQKAIQSGYVESHCAEYGVGLIRLMGRHAGFIAMDASAASKEVNVCLIPEFQWDLHGEKGLIQHVVNRLKIRRTCVIVVAEGAGDALRDAKLESIGKDASGNIKAGDIGTFLRDSLNSECKKRDIDVTLKYIDPTYMIRSVPANAHDAKLCSQLGLSAVHGLMAGYTQFSVGHVCQNIVYIPVDEMLNPEYTTRVTADNRVWQRLIAGSGQPSFQNEEGTPL